MASSLLALAKSIYYIYISTDRGVGGGVGAWWGGAFKEIGGSVLLPVWRHLSRSRQWPSKWQAEFIEETHENFKFITEKLFRFLGFGDMTIPIVTENQALVLF